MSFSNKFSQELQSPETGLKHEKSCRQRREGICCDLWPHFSLVFVYNHVFLLPLMSMDFNKNSRQNVYEQEHDSTWYSIAILYILFTLSSLPSTESSSQDKCRCNKYGSFNPDCEDPSSPRAVVAGSVVVVSDDDSFYPSVTSGWTFEGPASVSSSSTGATFLSSSSQTNAQGNQDVFHNSIESMNQKHRHRIPAKCLCRPGVGGVFCDRCEADFWGLQKIVVTDRISGCLRKYQNIRRVKNIMTCLTHTSFMCCQAKKAIKTKNCCNFFNETRLLSLFCFFCQNSL